MARVAAAPAGKLTASGADGDGLAGAVDLEDDLDEDDSAPDARSEGDSDRPGPNRRLPAGPTGRTTRRWWVAIGLGIVVVLAAIVGWISYRAHTVSAAQHQRDLFVQVGRQSAINLTTIDWQQADRDVARILDNATGSFHDDFANQSQSFIDVVKQSKSTTAGIVDEAGVESESGDSAQILVAVTVKTSNAAAPQQEPRSWRLRVGVQKTGQDIKVSNVEFVP